MSEYALSVKNISKKFKIHHEERDSIFESMTGFFQKGKHSETLQALDSISFDVKQGEIFGIIGPIYAGYIYDQYMDYRIAFTLIGILTFISIPLILMVKETKQVDEI